MKAQLLIAQPTGFGRGLAAMPRAGGDAAGWWRCRGLVAMPRADDLRLSVSRRRAGQRKGLCAKPGLKVPRGMSLALLLDCAKA